MQFHSKHIFRIFHWPFLQVLSQNNVYTDPHKISTTSNMFDFRYTIVDVHEKCFYALNMKLKMGFNVYNCQWGARNTEWWWFKMKFLLSVLEMINYCAIFSCHLLEILDLCNLLCQITKMPFFWRYWLRWERLYTRNMFERNSYCFLPYIKYCSVLQILHQGTN